MRPLVVGVVVAGLSACALGPDYVRPEVLAPASFQPEASVDGPGSVADLGWWTLYRDPVLDALIREAIAHNLDLRAAVARVEQARAVVGATGLGLFPQIEARGNATETRAASDTVFGGDRTRDSESVSVGLVWELDLWGRLRRENEAVRAELLGAEYARRGVMVGVVSQVANTWFQLATLREQLDITRATATTREQFLRLTRAQSERGVVSGLDVASAEAQLAQARASIPDFERQIAQAEHALSLLLGRNPSRFAGVSLDAASAMAPDVPAGLPSALLERRPDIQQAEQALVAANARVGSAKAALFPTISITGSYGSLSGPMSDLFTSQAENWSFGVGLVQPLLDADRNLYRVDLADARKAEALIAYESAVRSAFREVADALVAREKLADVERAQTALVEAQQRAEEIATARYKVGYSSYFDVINADRDLFNAKLARSTARLNARLATVQLYRALGGGWQMPESAPQAVTSAAAP